MSRSSELPGERWLAGRVDVPGREGRIAFIVYLEWVEQINGLGRIAAI
jgi:hypothetical protein